MTPLASAAATARAPAEVPAAATSAPRERAPHMAALSVVMPNFNHGHLLDRSVSALLRQSRPPAEIVLVDDASTDGSRAVIDRLAAEHPEVQPLMLPQNVGVLAALEAGLRQSSGDWFYGAGADDEVLPGFFEAASTMIRRHPHLGTVNGQILCAYDDHRSDELQTLADISDESVFAPEQARALLDRREAGASLSAATLYRRDAFDALGGFPARLGPWADTFVARALAAAHGFGHLARPCVRWSIHTQSYSHRGGRDAARMRDIGREAVALLREPRFAGLFTEDQLRRWHTRWDLEMAGGFTELRDTALPRRLRDVRRAYAELGRGGNPLDRVLSAVLRKAFARSDAKRRRADPDYSP